MGRQDFLGDFCLLEKIMVNRQQRQTMEKYNEALPLSGNLFEKNKRRISFFKLTKMMFLSTSSLIIVFVIIYGFIVSSKTNAESITQDKTFFIKI